MSVVLHFPSPPFDALECWPLTCTLDEILFEQAVDKFVTPEAMASWLESADHVLEQSKYFGPISNEGLWSVVLSRASTSEQRDQAVILLHKRFVDEHMDEIRAEVANN